MTSHEFFFQIFYFDGQQSQKNDNEFGRLREKLTPIIILKIKLQFILFMEAKELFNNQSRHFLEFLSRRLLVAISILHFYAEF
jgi:hypothetical protein